MRPWSVVWLLFLSKERVVGGEGREAAVWKLRRLAAGGRGLCRALAFGPCHRARCGSETDLGAASDGAAKGLPGSARAGLDRSVWRRWRRGIPRKDSPVSLQGPEPLASQRFELLLPSPSPAAREGCACAGEGPSWSAEPELPEYNE